MDDSDVKKILVLDRTPAKRRKLQSPNQAPPLFYPDLLADTAAGARIEVDLRQFLQETTDDPLWPPATNERQYARLIMDNLNGVARAHQNLVVANPGRFTDHDFQTIVAYAALGTLSAMTMCCLPDVSTMQVDGQTKMAVTCDPLHLLNFIQRDFMPMNLMCERAEMFERGIYDRSKAVFGYFGLPFDAEPPPS
jgi:hypothetical protein